MNEPTHVLDVPMYSDNELRAAVAAERERCQTLIRDLAASWRDSAIKAPDPDVAAEFEYVASSVDAAADLLDGAT